MRMDETLSSVADKIKNFAVVYLVDITEVPDFNAMYELYDPCTVMFFFRNKVRLICPCVLLERKEITFIAFLWLQRQSLCNRDAFPTLLLIAHCFVRPFKVHVTNMPHCDVLSW